MSNYLEDKLEIAVESGKRDTSTKARARLSKLLERHGSVLMTSGMVQVRRMMDGASEYWRCVDQGKIGKKTMFELERVEHE